uniref:CSON004568 protein n=1 Tax=Culicoides sonorensis TaxID=179676 RepID=A0A336MNU9_CULSO
MHFSTNFRGTRRAFAYVIRFIENCRNRIRTKNNVTSINKKIDYTCISIPTISDELHAELKFIVSIQQVAFAQEYSALKNDRPIPKNSKLNNLAPFIKDDIIRVGGRIHKSKLKYDAKHQILLPKDHPFTNSLVSSHGTYNDVKCHPFSLLAALWSPTDP